MEQLMYYDEEEEWNKALLLYNAALKEFSTKLEILNNEFKLAHQYNPIEHITSRLKSAQSIARKMRIKQKELTVENIIRYINDVAGIRIICTFTSDIYRIADAITNQNDVTTLKIKDYIANPKPNGYTSYHMIVSVPIFLSNIISFLDQKMLSINESVKNYHKDFNGGDVVNNDIDSISNTLKPLYGSIYTD